VSFIKPKRLVPGGVIGVVAPAGRVDPVSLHAGVARLSALGFQVCLGKYLEAAHRYFAGSDPQRAEDVARMFQSREVDAVVCARGGSGTARILPYLDPDIFSGDPKICVGASDITTLLLFLSSRGWVTFHGPMVATQFGTQSTPRMEEMFLRILSGERLKMQFPGVLALRAGRVEGPLTGGCLSLLCTTIGTAYEIRTDGCILFLEDTGEAPYRIDRMLSYLKGVGKFNHVLGVVFGQMPHCDPEALPEIIMDVLSGFQFPILFGFPSGHGDGTATLPLGTVCRLDTASGCLEMCEAAVR